MEVHGRPWNVPWNAIEIHEEGGPWKSMEHRGTIWDGPRNSMEVSMEFSARGRYDRNFRMGPIAVFHGTSWKIVLIFTEMAMKYFMANSTRISVELR